MHAFQACAVFLIVPLRVPAGRDRDLGLQRPGQTQISTAASRAAAWRSLKLGWKGACPVLGCPVVVTVLLGTALLQQNADAAPLLAPEELQCCIAHAFQGILDLQVKWSRVYGSLNPKP